MSAEPVAELITIRLDGKGRMEEFACLMGYRPPEGVTVISRQPLYLEETHPGNPREGCTNPNCENGFVYAANGMPHECVVCHGSGSVQTPTPNADPIDRL